jgi:mono/diheme cytochrome c family protein
MQKRLAITVLAAVSQAGFLMGQQIKDVQPATTQPNDGKAMFVNYCAPCHGTDGKGSGPAAGALKTKPTDLTALASRQNGVYPSNTVTRFIKGTDEVAAHGSRNMPVWGSMFKAMHPNDPAIAEIRVKVLVDYVKTIQAK